MTPPAIPSMTSVFLYILVGILIYYGRLMYLSKRNKYVLDYNAILYVIFAMFWPAYIACLIIMSMHKYLCKLLHINIIKSQD